MPHTNITQQSILQFFDNITFGFTAAQVIVVAGRPGMGKTTLAVDIAQVAIPNNEYFDKPIPTLFFSLEMPADALVKRMAVHLAKLTVPQNEKRFDNVTDSDSETFKEALNKINNASLFVEDKCPLNISELRDKIRQMKDAHGIGLIIIDYLQLIQFSESNLSRSEQLAEITFGIKAMSRELKIPVILLVQLNRSFETENREPCLSDFRDSNTLEANADTVLFIVSSATEESSEFNVHKDFVIAKSPFGTRTRVPMSVSDPKTVPIRVNF